MGSHKKWRKTAKKLRRKRKRTEIAINREKTEKTEQKRREQSPTYIKTIEDHEILEKFRLEEETNVSRMSEIKWLKTEEDAQKQWRVLQQKLEKIKEERLKEEERILQEWKREQQKIVDEKERRKRLQEENERKQELIKEKIDDFILNGGDTPTEFKVSIETNPTKQVCPFFSKTSACRFKDVCSRNHIRPGISKVLLFPNFYSHFSLEQTRDCEYGSNLSLEYDDRETYKHFLEFFEDVLKEFEKYGHVNQFKVCKNTEPHLRGNVYVEYSQSREALKAYKNLNGRWYAGKKINVEFCNITSWKAAICGLNYGKKCPKGSLCNFLHVFHNPGNLFRNADRDLHRQTNVDDDDDNNEYDSRNWRWSESPERNNDEKENYKNKRKYNKRRERNGRHHEHRRKHKRKSKSPNSNRKRKRKHS